MVDLVKMKALIWSGEELASLTRWTSPLTWSTLL
jgi:hypothetical protein